MQPTPEFITMADWGFGETVDTIEPGFTAVEGHFDSLVFMSAASICVALDPINVAHSPICQGQFFSLSWFQDHGVEILLIALPQNLVSILQVGYEL